MKLATTALVTALIVLPACGEARVTPPANPSPATGTAPAEPAAEPVEEAAQLPAEPPAPAPEPAPAPAPAPEKPEPAADEKPDAEPEKPRKPAEPAEPEPDENGRKATKEADAALARMAKLLVLPTSGAKTLSCEVSGPNPMGGTLKATPSWSATEGVELEVALPPEMTQGLPPENIKMFEGMVTGFFLPIFKRTFVSPVADQASYHVAHKQTKRGLRVELLPIQGREDIDWERLLLYFDDRGLVDHMTGIPRVDMNDPMAAMTAGAAVEIELTYGAVGDLHRLETVALASDASGNHSLRLEYFGIDGKALPARLHVKSDMLGPEAMIVQVANYTIDGAAVPGTEPPKKEEKPVEKPAEKKADGDADGHGKEEGHDEGGEKDHDGDMDGK